jgi:hypothetical protein
MMHGNPIMRMIIRFFKKNKKVDEKNKLIRGTIDVL